MKKRSRFLFCVVLGTLVLASNSYSEDLELGARLFEAVQFQDLAQIQELLAKGASVNHIENGRPLLGWAAQSGNIQVVEALLKARANPNLADIGFGQTPLMRAIDTQQVETVRILLKAKANPNAKSKDGKSCLMMATESRKLEIVKMLIEAGADVKEVTPDGSSPALSAAQDATPESLKILEILGAAKANLNASNAAFTPLVYALQQGNVELVKTLLNAGADPSAGTQSGHLPIQDALDSPELLKILLAAKADPNAKIGENRTPLGEAIYNNQAEAAKILIEAGADTTKGAPAGSTLLELAEQAGLSEVVELIKKKNGTDGAFPVIPVASDDTAPSVNFNPNSDKCTIVDAARKQMNLHERLQKQVDAGKKSDEVFRTFSKDTVEFGPMLTENPPAACKLLDRLATKYGVSWSD